MKHIFIVLGYLVLTLCAESSVALSRSNDPGTLIQKEKSYFDSIIKKDYAAVDVVFTDNYMGTYALGTIDKKREMEDVRQFPLVSYTISDPKVVYLNSKTGIISFKLSVKVVVDGKDFFEDDFMSCVWTKRKKDWLMSAQAAVKSMAKT